MAAPEGQERAGVCVAVAMQKGGVGKTTTVFSLARAAKTLGLRVLVIDFDPQGNTTDALAAGDLAADDVSVADCVVPESAMLKALPMADVLAESVWPDVDLVPCVDEDRLGAVQDHMQAMQRGREFRLRDALAPIRSNYDLILIDNGPHLSLLLTNALAAADKVLVVAEADRWSLTGLGGLERTIATIREYYQPNLALGGVLINKWRNTTDEHEKLEQFREHLDAAHPEAQLWAGPNAIPQRIGIKKHVNAGVGFDESSEASIRVLSGVYREVIRNLTGIEETADDDVLEVV